MPGNKNEPFQFLTRLLWVALFEKYYRIYERSETETMTEDFEDFARSECRGKLACPMPCDDTKSEFSVGIIRFRMKSLILAQDER